MSRSISAATEEQSTGARQVATAVESVNELTQQAAGAAEQMSAATTELSSLAQEMQRMVKQFKLPDQESAANAVGAPRVPLSPLDEAGQKRMHERPV